jgi:hypothetical protein
MKTLHTKFVGIFVIYFLLFFLSQAVTKISVSTNRFSMVVFQSTKIIFRKFHVPCMCLIAKYFMAAHYNLQHEMPLTIPCF